MHAGRGGEPVTLGDLKEQFAANNQELKSVKATIDSLPMEPLGTDGAEYAPLPNGTNVVKMPDGTVRLALPVRLGADLEITVGGSARLGKRDDE